MASQDGTARWKTMCLERTKCQNWTGCTRGKMSGRWQVIQVDIRARTVVLENSSPKPLGNGAPHKWELISVKLRKSYYPSLNNSISKNWRKVFYITSIYGASLAALTSCALISVMQYITASLNPQANELASNSENKRLWKEKKVQWWDKRRARNFLKSPRQQ